MVCLYLHSRVNREEILIMKILHLCICGPYTDGYAYQDNILPLKHKKLGYDVKVICSINAYDSHQQVVCLSPKKYIDGNGIKIIRLPFAFKHPIAHKLKVIKGLYSEICKFAPDIIFAHGVQFYGLRAVLKYKKKNSSVKVYIDNHADYVNTAIKNLKHIILQRYIFGITARKIVPYVEKFWGVTPTRMEYLRDIYRIPKEKIGLLVMGGDEEKIHRNNRELLRSKIFEKYKIPEGSFLICTGGKIDRLKNIHLLMQAMDEIPNSTLLVFGIPLEDMKEEFERLSQKDNIRSVGWIDSDKAYDLFVASDLVVFPGTHSVLWEQAVASGVPCIFKYYNGMTHVDVGDNCRFLYKDSVSEIKNTIINILSNKKVYHAMCESAETDGMREFSYIEIAKRSIGL